MVPYEGDCHRTLFKKNKALATDIYNPFMIISSAGIFTWNGRHEYKCNEEEFPS